MKSLQELNNHSRTSLEVTDNRGSQVIFDRVSPLEPLDITNPILATTVSVPPAGNEIVDIINYSTANTRFRVRITTGGSPLLTGSTLNFGTLPASLTLTVVGGVYTISGIKTVDDWDAIKYFVWNLPADFATCPLWYLDVAVLYYDSARNEEMVVDWEVYDPRFYYVAKLNSQFTQTSIIGNIKQANATLTVLSDLDCPGSRINRAQASASALTSMIAAGERTQIINPMINNISLNIFATEFNKFVYYKNTANLIALPAVEDYSDGSGTYAYTINVDPSYGEVGTLNSVGSVHTISGTRTYINTLLNTVYYYPVFDRTTNSQFTLTLSKNGSQIYQKTFTIYYNGITSLSNFYYSFTSNNTWTPNFIEKKYYTMDVLLVGGGGAGQAASTPIDTTSDPYGESGGGAGQLIQITGDTISLTGSYSISIGAGASSSGARGGSTVFGSYTALGGYGASPTSKNNTIPQTIRGKGGNNGDNTKVGGAIGNGFGQGSGFETSFSGGGGGGSFTGTPSPVNQGPFNGDGGNGAQSPFQGGAGGYPTVLTWNPAEGSTQYAGGGRGQGPSGSIGVYYNSPGSGGQGGRYGQSLPISGFAGIVKIRTRPR